MHQPTGYLEYQAEPVVGFLTNGWRYKIGTIPNVYDQCFTGPGRSQRHHQHVVGRMSVPETERFVLPKATSTNVISVCSRCVIIRPAANPSSLVVGVTSINRRSCRKPRVSTMASETEMAPRDFTGYRRSWQMVVCFMIGPRSASLLNLKCHSR